MTSWVRCTGRVGDARCGRVSGHPAEHRPPAYVPPTARKTSTPKVRSYVPKKRAKRGNGDWLRSRAGGSQFAAKMSDPYGKRRPDSDFADKVETYARQSEPPLMGDKGFRRR